jgi:hypothetical protein
MSVPDYPAGTTIHRRVTCRGKASAPETGDSLTFAVHKGGSNAGAAVTTTTGLTYHFSGGWDGKPGLILFTIDTSDAFYASNNDYSVVATGGTVDDVPITGEVAFEFSIEKQTSSRVNVRAAVGISGATLSADLFAIYGGLSDAVSTLATVDSNVTAIVSDVNTIETAVGNIPKNVLIYDFEAHSGAIPPRSLFNASRAIISKWTLPVPGTLPGSGTHTVYAEDGTTPAFTRTVTFDSSGNITGEA